VALLLGLALYVGAVRAWGFVASQPEFRLARPTLTFGRCPDYVRAQEMGRDLAKHWPDASILDNDLWQTVEHDLRGSPWVLEVLKVRRLLPNRVQLELRFRAPAGLVHAGSRVFTVDRDGFMLPKDLYRKPAKWEGKRLPVIVASGGTDGSSAGHPPLGSSWQWPSVAVGARLSAFLFDEGLFEELEVRRIDVRRVGRAGAEAQIVLDTDSGVIVKWGRSDAYAHIESLRRWQPVDTDAYKLEMLRTTLAEHPGLEGLSSVDLPFRKGVSLPSQGD